jgi:hypothetical protein
MKGYTLGIYIKFYMRPGLFFEPRGAFQKFTADNREKLTGRLSVRRVLAYDFRVLIGASTSDQRISKKDQVKGAGYNGFGCRRASLLSNELCANTVKSTSNAALLSTLRISQPALIGSFTILKELLDSNQT